MEIDLQNALSHANIVNLVDAYESPREMMLVMDLVRGGELFERLIEEECVSEMDVTFFMKQILHALQHMHERNIVHLDLKVRGVYFCWSKYK